MSTRAEIQPFLSSRNPNKYFELRDSWPDWNKIPSTMGDVRKYSPNFSNYPKSDYKAKLNFVQLDTNKPDSCYAWLELVDAWTYLNAHIYIKDTILFKYESGQGSGSLVNQKPIPIGDKSLIEEYRIFKMVDNNGEESWIDIIKWIDNSNPALPGQEFVTGWRW